jgi:hypothetical protein
MASIVENLLPLFGIQDEDTSHEALCQHIRDVVNEDTSGDLSLADEIEHARNKFEDLYAGGEFAPSVAGQLRNIGEVSKALQVVHKEQLDARAELDKEFADLASEISVAQDIPTEQDEDEEPKDGEEENDDADDEGEEEEEKTGEVETVSADASPAPAKVRPASSPVRLPTASALNAYRPEQQTNYGGSKVRYQIVAAADVPRTPSGSSLNIRELGEAVNRKFSTLPVGQRNVSPRRGSVALIRRNFDRSLKTYSDKRDISTIDRVADERNLPGGSLIAAARSHRQALTAAGCCTDMSNDIWCSPSETDYSLCPPLATLEGLVDLPTVEVNHGGLRYPVWSMPESIGQAVRNTCDDPIEPDHFTQPDNEKVCVEGPCPEWHEHRLNLAYLCIQGDILRTATMPELTERFVEDALVQHRHFMNHTYLNEIFTKSDTLPAFDVSADGIGSTVDSVLDRLALLIAWFRERYHLGMTDTLEGILPAWFRSYVKADLARRNNRPFAAVTDAEVEDLFAQYATRIQWVYDTEGITEDASLPNGAPTDEGLPMPGPWPNAVEMVFYPAGSWVLGQQDIITLDAHYDSTQLKQNKYTSLFFEEGWMLFNRCNRSFRIRLENLCRAGGVGAGVDVTCPEPQVPDPDPGS